MNLGRRGFLKAAGAALAAAKLISRAEAAPARVQLEDAGGFRPYPVIPPGTIWPGSRGLSVYLKNATRAPILKGQCFLCLDGVTAQPFALPMPEDSTLVMASEPIAAGQGGWFLLQGLIDCEIEF